MDRAIFFLISVRRIGGYIEVLARRKESRIDWIEVKDLKETAKRKKDQRPEEYPKPLLKVIL